MNTEHIISGAINEIQDESCRNCEAGKCLIRLKSILDDMETEKLAAPSGGLEKPDKGKSSPGVQP